MTRFWRWKFFLVYTLAAAFLASSTACGYRPSYLQKSKKTRISERWQVERINESRLSPDEKAVFETRGIPQFVRFYRRNSLDREKVYAWIYNPPPAVVTFIDGKKVDYVVLDDDLSSFNEYQRNTLFWGGIAGGSVAGLGLLYYLFFLK